MGERNAKRSQNVAFRVIQDAALIVDSRQGKLFTLNDVGAAIWVMLDGSHTVEDIVERVQASFLVEAERARQDALAFLDVLEEKRIIVWKSGTTEPI